MKLRGGGESNFLKSREEVIGLKREDSKKKITLYGEDRE